MTRVITHEPDEKRTEQYRMEWVPCGAEKIVFIPCGSSGTRNPIVCWCHWISRTLSLCSFYISQSQLLNVFITIQPEQQLKRTNLLETSLRGGGSRASFSAKLGTGGLEPIRQFVLRDSGVIFQN